MLEHGGRLNQAARHWGIPVEEWLDLSTGIAPWPYPLPAVPATVWQRLPEEDDGLKAVAADYYGVDTARSSVLILPGSQAAIQRLPFLLPPGRVAMAMPLYNEHPASWQAAGHRLVGWEEEAEVAVLCRPNNPTGQWMERESLIDRAAKVRLLLVDEAFLDAWPAAGVGQSLAACGLENVLVLRSLGKFFGLAGVRLGCLIAASAWTERLGAVLGPWAVSHPARWAARCALADAGWQQLQRERLRSAANTLGSALRQAGLPPAGGCGLFQYCPTPRAERLFESLARRGILVRLFREPSALRFGLPATEEEMQRLVQALRECE